MKFLPVVVLLFGLATSASRLEVRQDNSLCAQWCAANFPDNSGSCTSAAAHGTGPCYQCGPKAASSSTLTLCSGACVDPSSDATNCGVCGNACPTGIACTNGSCAPPDPFACDNPNDTSFLCGDRFCECATRLDGTNVCVESRCPSLDCTADPQCAPLGAGAICVHDIQFQSQGCCTFPSTACSA